MEAEGDISARVRELLLTFSTRVATEFSLDEEQVDWCWIPRPSLPLKEYGEVFGGIFRQYSPEELSSILRYRYSCPLFERVRKCISIIDTFLDLLLNTRKEDEYSTIQQETKAAEYLQSESELVSFSSCVSLIKVAEEKTLTVKLSDLNSYPRTVIRTFCQYGCLSVLQFLVPKVKYSLEDLASWIRTAYYFSYPDVFLYLLSLAPQPLHFLSRECNLTYLSMLYPREFLRIVEGIRPLLQEEDYPGVFSYQDLTRGVTQQYLEKNPDVLGKEFERWALLLNEDFTGIGRSFDSFFRLIPEKVLLKVYKAADFVLIHVLVCVFKVRPEIFTKYTVQVETNDELAQVYPLRTNEDLRNIVTLFESLDNGVILRIT